MKLTFTLVILCLLVSVNSQAQVYDLKSDFSQNIAQSALEYPLGISLSGASLYALSQNDTVYKFSLNGELQATFINEKTQGANALKIFNDTCYFARNGDGFVSEVVVTKTDGTFIRQFGSRGFRDDQWAKPIDLCIDSAKNVFVVDQQRDRVLKYSNKGRFIKSWLLNGGTGSFGLNPVDIETDNKGHLYVLCDNSTIQKYDSAGTYIKSLEFNPGGNDYYLSVKNISYNPFKNTLYTVIDSIVDFGVKKKTLKIYNTDLVDLHQNTVFKSEWYISSVSEMAFTQNDIFLSDWNTSLYQFKTIVTGVEDSYSQNSSSFNLYPNPSSYYVSIVVQEDDSPFSYTVTDVHGKERITSAHFKVGKEEILDVTSLENGLYLVSIEQHGKKTVKKLSINK